MKIQGSFTDFNEAVQQLNKADDLLHFKMRLCID